ncbi:MAG: tetratricopeptide repeat protein [Planctomycetota bacterium]
MQRYRINYKWLIGFFVSCLVLAVTSYFVWAWQVERKAGNFIVRAEEALDEDDAVEAYRYFYQYVRLRPKDTEARIKMANCALDVMGREEVPIEKRQHAFRLINETVRRTNDPSLRRELARMSRPTDALVHIKGLLESSPQDSELNGMLVQALYTSKKFDQVKKVAFDLIGYDKKADEFDSEKATLVGEPNVYAILAEILNKRDDNEELAERVIDQMIEANPEVGDAYLNKSSFLLSQRKYDEAADYLNQAYQLDPTNATALMKLGMVALSDPSFPERKQNYFDAISALEDAVDEIESGTTADSQYKEARSDFKKAISMLESAQPTYAEAKMNFADADAAFDSAIEKLMGSIADKVASAKDTDQTAFTEAQAELTETKSALMTALPKPEKAQEYIAKGLEEHPDNVMFYKLMAQTQNRLSQTDEAIKTLDEGILDRFDENRSIDLVFYKIDLLLEKEDYAAIDKEIDRLNSLRRQDLQPMIDFQQARIDYRKKDWAAASKELKRIHPLLFSYPKYQIMARTMLGISYESQGIGDLALQAYESVLKDYPNHSGAQSGRARILARIGKSEGEGVELDQIVNKTLELPKAEQDWAKVDELLEQVIKKNNLSVAQQKMLRAKILIKRQQYAEAKALIREASKADPDDINVQYTAILLYMTDPSQGPEQAMKLIDLLEKKWGRSLRSIIQRADILALLRPEDVGSQLRQLVTDAEQLTGDNAIDEAGRLRLYKVLGLKFEQLSMYTESREYYELTAAAEPNNLPLRMHLFELALKERSDEAMVKAQEGILEIVQNKNHPNYVLTDVRRNIIRFALGQIDRAELANSRRQLDNALLERPKWHELHITYGQLLLIIGEDIDLALEHFDDALQYGRAKSTAVGVQVKLLAERGLNDQAMERMLLLRKDLRNPMLGKTHADILIKNGRLDAAFEAAQELAETQPNNPTMQAWFSRVAQQTGDIESAIDALAKSLELKPSDPDSWIRLIGLQIENKQFDKVEEVMRRAHLASDPEYLPMLTAKYYELLSRWQNAEDIYLATYRGQEDNLNVSRRMADFYLLWSKKDEANIGRAAVYINRILKAANEGTAAADNPHVVWARQKAAKILYARNDYRQSLKAERLLRDSATGGKMDNEESSLLADILISRDDPSSLLEAKQLLQQMRSEQRLTRKGAMQLANILTKTDQWDEAKTLLREQIQKFKTDAQLRITYINLLIEQGEFTQAERSLKRLQDMDKANPSIIQLSARIASEQGDQARLVALLQSILPKNRSTMTPKELNQLFSVAQLANRYGAYDMAGELYKTVAQRDGSKVFDLAKFHAYHGDCAVALDLMKRLFDDRMDDVVQLASRMLSKRRDEVGDTYDADVDRLISRAMRDDPDAISRQLARAEVYETQGKHKESVAAYDEILSRNDLPTQLRALAMNNLGFQLGLLNQRVDEAEQMINEAIETFGPVEDMLDTRAVVRIAQQKYDLAIEDMKLALSVSRDPVKYFHLAKAYALAGDGQAAMQAWEMAKKNGFEQDALPSLEQAVFDEIRQKIESFETQSAKL